MVSRYVPTAEERAAIDLLRLAGYAVARQRTYDGLLERVSLAEHRQAYEIERREGTERWVQSVCAEERRLYDRLNEVCYAAAALGVDIQAINDALHRANAKRSGATP